MIDQKKKIEKKIGTKKNHPPPNERLSLFLKFPIRDAFVRRVVASIDRAGVNEDVIVDDDDVFSSSLLSGEKNSRRPRWIWM